MLDSTRSAAYIQRTSEVDVYTQFTRTQSFDGFTFVDQGTYDLAWSVNFVNRPSSSYDVIVIGVGGMGSATAWHLARRGCRVLGLEQFNIPNDLGSSHGQTRIIRLATPNTLPTCPLLRRTYGLWREIQDRAGEQLLHITGALDAGPADDWVFQGSKSSCEEHGLPHEILTGEEVKPALSRLPAS